MYSTDRDRIPSKPVITSLTHANHELAAWMRENDFSHIIDGDGMLWSIRVKVSEKPNKSLKSKRVWDLSFYITARPTTRDFVLSKTLDSQQDERLLSMLGDQHIPMHMRPVHVSAHSIEEARTVFAQTIVDLRRKMRAQSLHDTKRYLIGRFVDESCQFSLR
jgi:hypothetical protein